MMRWLTSMLEKMYGSLTLLGLGAGLERAEVSASAGLVILLPRVESVSSGREFSDHRVLPFRAITPADAATQK
jgi:hypothetical protein